MRTADTRAEAVLAYVGSALGAQLHVISAIAIAALTALGEGGESLGYDGSSLF